MTILKKLSILILLLTVVSCMEQKQYVSYRVKKGDTMESIAKRHKISKSELYKINPGIHRNPPPNTYLIVPKVASAKKKYKKPKKNKKNINKASKTYKSYRVRKGDTLYSLSKRFGMTMDDLISINPSLKNGLKTGMELIYVESKLHKVVKGDTVYNLTHRYNVSSEELYKANPKLYEGLKLGMMLKIPTKNIVTENNEDDEIVTEVENTNSNSLFLENFSTGKIAHIAVLLPYQINKLTNNSVVEEKFQSKNSLTNIATDFHQGVEMAIDSLRKRGVQVKATFFDTENSKRKVANLVLRNNFSKYDAIIGPLFFDNAEVVASQISNVPVILPFYSKKQSESSSANLIKSMPDDDEIINRLIDYISTHHTNEKILVVTDDKPHSKHRLWSVVNKLKAINTVKDLSVLKPEKGYIDKRRFNEKIEPHKPQWVLLIGDDTVTISDVVNNLGTYPESRYKIRLFGLEKGTNFDGLVNNNYLGKLQFTYPASAVYNNTSTPKLRAFYNSFKVKNNTLPNKYALRGFDVTYDIVARLVSYNTLMDGILQGKSERFSSVFNYTGQTNQGIVLVEYTKDLQIKIIE